MGELGCRSITTRMAPHAALPPGCRRRAPGEGHGADEPPPLLAGDDVVLRGVVGCALARLQLALEGGALGWVGAGTCRTATQCDTHVRPLPRHAACVTTAAQPAPGKPSREQESAVALRLMAWIVQLGQAPALRRVICQESLQPASAAAAVQAAAAVASAGAPPEAAAVARMLQQQREGLLAALEAALPLPADSEPGQAVSPRPLPAVGPGGAHGHPLLYWQLSCLLPLGADLVEVGGWVRQCLLLADRWLKGAALLRAPPPVPAARPSKPPRCQPTPLHPPTHADGWQELTSLHILLLYSLAFKEAYGSLLLAFYPWLGGGWGLGLGRCWSRPPLLPSLAHASPSSISLTHQPWASATR